MDALRRLITNERYRGVDRSGDTVNLSARETIVPIDLWELVQALYAAGAERPAPPDGEGRELGYQNVTNPRKRKDTACGGSRGDHLDRRSQNPVVGADP